MKIVDVEQGTEEWLKWRKTVITATDCPAIMGSSPWSTPYKCWQNKLGLSGDKAPNAAMQRGKDLEPIARDIFSRNTGITMKSAVIESSEYSILGASLDGISSNKTMILEIKCGGEKLHALAKDSIIPEYYMDQIQHQILVTRAVKAFYLSFDGVDGIIISVSPDPSFEERFLKKAREFWKCVANAEPPPMSQNDYKDMSLSHSWERYSNIYRDVEAQIKTLENLKADMRQKLIEMCENQSCRGNGIKVINQTRKGRIAYDEIEELNKMDLEKYRKPPTQSWLFFTEK